MVGESLMRSEYVSTAKWGECLLLGVAAPDRVLIEYVGRKVEPASTAFAVPQIDSPVVIHPVTRDVRRRCARAAADGRRTGDVDGLRHVGASEVVADHGAGFHIVQVVAHAPDQQRYAKEHEADHRSENEPDAGRFGLEAEVVEAVKAPYDRYDAARDDAEAFHGVSWCTQSM